jgi:uncharacterized protein DUF4115
MKSTPAPPTSRTATPAPNRDDVEPLIRSLMGEREQLQGRVADLEAVLRATIEVLQARVASHNHETSSASTAHPLPNRSPRLTRWVGRLLVATATIAAVLYVRVSALNSVRSSQAGIVGEPATQVAAPAVRQEPQPGTPAGPVVSERPNDGLTIAVSARDRCWISATLDGKRKLERLMQRGETTILHALEEVVLKAGNAGALSLTINGLAGAPLGRRGQTVTTRITQDNYLRFTEQGSRR